MMLNGYMSYKTTIKSVCGYIAIYEKIINNK